MNKVQLGNISALQRREKKKKRKKQTDRESNPGQPHERLLCSALRHPCSYNRR